MEAIDTLGVVIDHDTESKEASEKLIHVLLICAYTLPGT